MGIWLLDCFKQFASMMLVHSLNVIFAMTYNKLSHIGDECTWYFVTYITDTFMTTLTAMGIMKLLDYCFDRWNLIVGPGNSEFEIRELLHH